MYRVKVKTSAGTHLVTASAEDPRAHHTVSTHVTDDTFSASPSERDKTVFSTREVGLQTMIETVRSQVTITRTLSVSVTDRDRDRDRVGPNSCVSGEEKRGKKGRQEGNAYLISPVTVVVVTFRHGNGNRDMMKKKKDANIRESR